MIDRIRTALLALGVSVLMLGLPGCGSRQPSPSASHSNPKPAGDQTSEKSDGKKSSQAGAGAKPSPASTPKTVTMPSEAVALPSSTKSNELPTTPAAPVTPQPQQVVRPDDQRPARNDRMLAQLGIRRFESSRLILYTDIDPQVAG